MKAWGSTSDCNVRTDKKIPLPWGTAPQPFTLIRGLQKSISA